MDLELYPLRPSARHCLMLIGNSMTQGIDILYELNKIYHEGLITLLEWRDLSEKYSCQLHTGRRAEMFSFFMDMHGRVFFYDIMQHISPQRIILSVRTTIDENHSLKLYTCFKIVKDKLDSNDGTDRLDLCTRLGNALLLKANAATDRHIRQFHCDRYVITNFLLIQQLRDGGFESRKRVIDTMMQCLPPDVDGNFAYLMYQLKIATSKVNANDLEEAEHGILDVLREVQFSNNSLMRALVYHDSSYVYRCIHSTTKRNEYVDKIADMSHKAIQTLDEFPPKTSTLGRILLLQMAKIYLGIDSKLNVDSETPLGANRIPAAMIVEQLRADIGNMETRREMFLQLCQARLHEDGNHMEKAMYCAQRALKLAEAGGYFPSDQENIQAYCTRLVIKVYPPAM